MPDLFQQPPTTEEIVAAMSPIARAKYNPSDPSDLKAVERAWLEECAEYDADLERRGLI